MFVLELGPWLGSIFIANGPFYVFYVCSLMLGFNGYQICFIVLADENWNVQRMPENVFSDGNLKDLA